MDKPVMQNSAIGRHITPEGEFVYLSFHSSKGDEMTFLMTPAEASIFGDQLKVLLGENDVLDLPVWHLRLSSRIKRIFGYSGIKTIRDLVAKNASELTEMPNFGITCLREVEERLSLRGLALRVDPSQRRIARFEKS